MKVVVMVLVLGACASSERAAEESAVDGVPRWLEPLDTCPADLAPARAAPYVDVSDRCPDEAACRESCRVGHGGACYFSALAAQEAGQHALADGLFLRGCKLGHASACTNRAASMVNADPVSGEQARCAAQTFELSCGWDDPWGCTMLGQSLAIGMGIAEDRARALEVLAKACAADASDPACVMANDLAKRLRLAREAGP